MKTNVVLIGLAASVPVRELAAALRPHCRVTCLLHAGPGIDQVPDATCFPHTEWLFRHHTGTVREAGAVVVCSDVPSPAAVTRWALDQAGGLVAHCAVDHREHIDDPESAASDLQLTCTSPSEAGACAAALARAMAQSAARAS